MYKQVMHWHKSHSICENYVQVYCTWYNNFNFMQMNFKKHGILNILFWAHHTPPGFLLGLIPAAPGLIII